MGDFAMNKSEITKDAEQLRLNFDICCSMLCANTKYFGSNDLTGWMLRQLCDAHAKNPSFKKELYQFEWFKVEFLQVDKKTVLRPSNLYSFIVLCGETPEPWRWTDEQTYMGIQGFYEEQNKCFVLKRRSHSNKVKILASKYLTK